MAAAAFAARNVFVPDTLLGFYDQFVAVDRDHNGMVSEDEMAVSGCCWLTCFTVVTVYYRVNDLKTLVR